MKQTKISRPTIDQFELLRDIEVVLYRDEKGYLVKARAELVHRPTNKTRTNGDQQNDNDTTGT